MDRAVHTFNADERGGSELSDFDRGKVPLGLLEFASDRLRQPADNWA